jgi:hypothetical protein
MKVNNIYRVLLLALAFSAADQAVSFCETPYAYLTNLIISDYNGDALFRVRKVLYSDVYRQFYYTKKLDKPDTLPEAYDLDSSQLRIVKEYKIVSRYKINDCISCIKVMFTDIAALSKLTISGFGDEVIIKRQIRRFPPNKKELVSYCTLLQDGQWKLIDPRPPRVKMEKVVEVLKGELIQQSELLASQPGMFRKKWALFYENQIMLLQRINRKCAKR